MADTGLLQGKKILVVDDEPDILEVMKETLKICRVVTAANFEDAKALLETQRDISDEAIWGIITARYQARKAAELKRLGNLQVLRTLEKQKMHKEQQD